MSKVLNHIRAAGLSQHYFRKYVSLRVLVDEQFELTTEKFELWHIFIGWVCLAVGLSLAILSFMVEFTFNKNLRG